MHCHRPSGGSVELPPPYLNGRMPDGKPTRIKNRANACEKCSRNGDRSRQRSPNVSACRERYVIGRLTICLKSTTNEERLSSALLNPPRRCKPSVRPFRTDSHLSFPL